MISSQRVLSALRLLCLFGVASSSSFADVNARLVLTSDYIYRGLSQSADAVTVQGSLEYQFEAGVFAGVWLSQIDYGFDQAETALPGEYMPYTDNRTEDDVDFANLEVDYFVGFERRVAKQFAFDVSLVHHDYRGSQGGLDLDWTELSVSAYLYDHWIVSLGVADRWLAEKQNTGNVELSYLYPLPLGIIFDVTLGVQYAEDMIDSTLTYAESGVGRNFGKLSARLAYSALEEGADEVFGDRAENKWLASLAWSF
jgi:uncharacterized protein (TIGR02001 family)